jgi:hypothetical protein
VSLRSAVDEAGESREQGGDMHSMLRDVFGTHEVKEENCEPKVVVHRGEEIVNEEAAEGETLKYYNLLEKADNPLCEGTKHSKLSATIHLYNLKCVGGLSNNIFSDFLELIIQLMPTSDETLPVNTYEANKFLRDVRLRYEKIPACRNNCMLFWRTTPSLIHVQSVENLSGRMKFI